MLYDPKWEISTKPKERWRQILLEAAELIKKNGHCKYAMSEGDKHCILGALTAVQTWDEIENHVMNTACRTMDRLLECGSYMVFNDAPETTDSDIIKLMRAAALSSA